MNTLIGIIGCMNTHEERLAASAENYQLSELSLRHGAFLARVMAAGAGFITFGRDGTGSD